MGVPWDMGAGTGHSVGVSEIMGAGTGYSVGMPWDMGAGTGHNSTYYFYYGIKAKMWKTTN